MIEVTDEMREVIKSNIYLNITESTNRANITISGDFQGICQSIIELHEANKPKRKPLSDMQLHCFADECTPNTETGGLNYKCFARAIEQAHGIGTIND